MNSYLLLARDILRTFGWRLGGPYGLTIVIGVTEGLGVAMLFPLLTHLGIAGSAEGSPLVGVLDEAYRAISPDGRLGPLIVMLIAIFTLQAGVFLTQTWLTAYYQRKYTAIWQKRLFTGFVEAEWSFLSQHKSGELLNAITVETGRLAAAFVSLNQLFAAIVITAIYLAAAMFVSWQVTLLLSGAALLMALSVIRLVRKSYDIGRLFGPLNARLSILVGEYLSAIRVVKSAIAETFVARQVAEVVDKSQEAHRTATFVPNFVRGVFEFVSLTGLVLLLAIGPAKLDIAPANMLVVMGLFLRLFPRLTSLQQHIHNLNALAPAIDIVTELARDAEAHREPRLETRETAPEYELPATLRVLGLDVRYASQNVLSGVDMSIAVPGMTAIVGASGAGKTTLVNVLAGLVRPTRGSVSLGGVRLEDTPLRAWRRLISYVSQEATLFHLTVRENIAFASPHSTDQEIRSAARRAVADRFVRSLPEGYDTLVGDQGGRLSGGQRQRLAIARALLRNPAILLLDEPTSALDSESEKAVLETLDELRGDVGIVIVAHRLATVRNADTIYVLEAGRLVEQGTWDDLIKLGGRFAELARKQHILAA